jgi:hypothetical protein
MERKIKLGLESIVDLIDEVYSSKEVQDTFKTLSNKIEKSNVKENIGDVLKNIEEMLNDKVDSYNTDEVNIEETYKQILNFLSVECENLIVFSKKDGEYLGDYDVTNKLVELIKTNGIELRSFDFPVKIDLIVNSTGILINDEMLNDEDIIEILLDANGDYLDEDCEECQFDLEETQEQEEIQEERIKLPKSIIDVTNFIMWDDVPLEFTIITVNGNSAVIKDVKSGNLLVLTLEDTLIGKNVLGEDLFEITKDEQFYINLFKSINSL